MACDPQGGLKNIPAGAEKFLLLNQADTVSNRAEIIRQSFAATRQFDRVLVGSMRSPENGLPVIDLVTRPVAGVILAAGVSSRYGAPKQLLDWRGKVFIRHVAERALAAGLWPVLAVLGAHSEEIGNALQGLPVELVMNPNWELGQSGSVIKGIDQIERQTAGAVFLMSDMPHVPVDLIRELIFRGQTQVGGIVSPRVNGQRANPVFFGENLFGQMRTLQGDRGGRVLFEQNPVEWIDWPDASLAFDINTQADYRRFLEMNLPDGV